MYPSRMKWIWSAVFFAMLGSVGSAADEPSAFPYEEFLKATDKNSGQPVDGVPMIPIYLKPLKPGDQIDLKKANFRITMPGAKAAAIPLHCEVLPKNADDAKNPTDQSRIRAGFTHKLWVPKDPEKYAGSALLNDLPAGFLDVQFALPPKPEKQ